MRKAKSREKSVDKEEERGEKRETKWDHKSS